MCTVPSIRTYRYRVIERDETSRATLSIFKFWVYSRIIVLFIYV